ncbi:hypothetical protein [Streptosporangium saharense]|uniref:hypothetical protein n=1 Tax=Streptosporangium saharense TaxID=1706840 RepID=UPI00332B46F0
MTRIGVTGHMDLTEQTAELVTRALRERLGQVGGELVGVSCLARGADSLFADAVLRAGGALEVVLPSRDYRQAKVKADHAEQFDRLLDAASQVRVMDFEHASGEAYVAANETVLGSVHELVAVWDGVLPAKEGGTADVVAQARRRGLPVHIIWPQGAARG